MSLREGLFHDYKKYGKVTAVRIINKTSVKQAVVCFRKQEDAEKALESSHDKKFFGSKVEVEPHEGLELDEGVEQDEYHHKSTRTLFIGNLEKDVTASDLRKKFHQYGQILEVEIKKQNCSTFAFCQYSDIKSVVAAMLAMDGEYLGTHRIKLGFGKCMPTRCVWLDGVSDAVTDTFLKDEFCVFGVVNFLIIDRKRGQALIFFDSVSETGFLFGNFVL